MKNLWTLLLFGLLPLFVYAQPSAEGLLHTWQNTVLPDSERLSALDALTKAVLREDPDSACQLAIVALQFAQDTRDPVAQARALANIGMSWRLRSDFPKAIAAYQTSIQLLSPLHEQTVLADVYKNLSDVYRLQSDFTKALEYVNLSLSLAEEIGDQRRIADAYVCFSLIHYMNSEDHEQTREYLLKAKPLYEAAGYEEGLAYIYNNLAILDIDLGDWSKGLQNIQQCLDIQQKRNDMIGMATSFQNRATIFSELGRFGDAARDLEQEVAIFKKIGDLEGLSDAYSSLGDLYLMQQKPAEALRWCKAALQHAVLLGRSNLNEQNACHCLYRAYAQKGDYKSALRYLERYALVSDTLNAQETETKLRQMEIDRDSLGRAKAEWEKKKDFEHQLRQKNQALLTLVAFIALAVLVAWAFWTRMLYFKRRSLDMQVRSETMEKQQLLNEVTLLRTQVNPHFLFNSLSILSSLVHKNADLSEQFVEQLARSYRYILEQNDQALVSLRTELEFIRAYAFLLKIRFEQKFDLDIDLPPDALDRLKIAPLTLQLLVENAVKHNRMSTKEPLVVKVRSDGQYLEVRNALRPRGEAAPSMGLGLQNIINRYALLSELSVKAGEQEGDFVVRVPLV